MLSMVGPFAGTAGSARADVQHCTATADPTTHGGLQALMNAVGASGDPDPVACIPSGTYIITNALTLPITMTVVGIANGAQTTPPTIDCSANTYCFNGSAGPNDVSLQHLSMSGAHKADVQIGTGDDSKPIVSGWTLSGITTTSAGQVGISMNNASDITISGATVDGNGTQPYDMNANPTGDFGLRANQVDGLTVQDSIISNNPATAALDAGFSGGAKFNTTTNLLVQHNDFTGNAGGAQLWMDISSHDFHAVDNTLEEVPAAGTGLLPRDTIRVEVSCAGATGSFIEDNVLTGGTVAGIDIFDSNGITVQHNTVTVPHTTTPNFGIRMFGNIHNPVPDEDCKVGGAFPNQDNVATDNAIDLSGTANAVDGVQTDDLGGVSTGNVWSDNTYTMRHCDPNSAANDQWTWWDGAANQAVGYHGWQAFGQDVGGLSTCTSIYPQINTSDPFDPAWGPVGTAVTIHGSGFTNMTWVKFNSVMATFTRTDTAITTTVPAGATTGTVCVKNPVNTTCSVANFVVADPEALTVTTSGTGTGTVTSLAPNPGIDCGTTCQANFPQGGSVTLHAEPDLSSMFTGWSGGVCSGTTDCTVSMDTAQSVTATFTIVDHLLSVTRVGAGTGVVTSDPSGIDCGATCSANYVQGTVVGLTATPDAGMAFGGWSGDCAGAGPCNVTMDAARSVTATFTVAPPPEPLKDNDPAVAYNGWSGVIDGAADAGAYRMSGVKNDKATWTSGVTTSITWITRTGPDGGMAAVTIDGKDKGTVDLYSAAPATLSKVFSGLSKKAHTVVINVLHTKNGSSSGYNVRLDAFVVKAVTTQESDPSITYDTWKSTAGTKATDGTFRVATTNKATVTVTFTGSAIDWTTTKGAAYGMASVSIDGVAQGTVDLYQAATAWQSVVSYGGLAAGPHTLVIQVLGQKNAAATSTKVVVDGFIVHA